MIVYFYYAVTEHPCTCVYDVLYETPTFENRQLISTDGWQFIIIDKLTFSILETDV